MDLPVPAEPLQARLQGAFCQPGRRSDQLHMLASKASPDQNLHRSGTCILVWVMVLVDPSTPNKCWQRCSQHKPVVAECCGRAQVLIPIPLCASARSMPKVCAACQAQWSTGTKSPPRPHTLHSWPGSPCECTGHLNSYKPWINTQLGPWGCALVVKQPQRGLH